MSITNERDLAGMRKVSEAVAVTLKEMCEFVRPGMSTKMLDDFGGQVLGRFGARSAPRLTYNFPGHTCISLNGEIAHGIPSANRIIREGDLLNIDVSAELDGYWSDNGGSMVVGEDARQLCPLVDISKSILKKAIGKISAGVRMNEIGGLMEKEAKKNGYRVIRNLGGHGVGKSLHEEPHDILNYRDRYDRRRFRKNTVIAVETFITTASTLAVELPDGFTLIGNRGGYGVQHEHTIIVTDGQPVILTARNGI
ncbi:type I methionyl aminopeptidase [Compostibacter hankyongensis]|uniref:Methionine aminopeptidase n=1 Tax=Compostibacter hankyongensis TaxID=1007089 RepID=A0ABP8G6B8_9BACT